MTWYEVKLFAAHASGASMDALHVVAGVALQLLAAALFRTPVASWRPWLAVLGLELLNEAADLLVECWPQPAMQFGEAANDLVLTMALPTALLLAARYRPALFSAARRSE
uniref:hypothetical protein n=1 Tax=uncultured Sphingomonas sp. TaxID=158754 RepID=UPI0025FB3347|nr:hypothetical protein [uncultured Sphingomonas sp.]